MLRNTTAMPLFSLSGNLAQPAQQEKKQAEIGNLQAREFPVSSCWLMLADAGRLCASLSLGTAEVPRKRLWRRPESLGRVSPLESRTWSVDASRIASARGPEGQGAVLRADVISGSKTALANPSLTRSRTFVPSSSPYTNRKSITLPPPRHQCFPSALAPPLAEPIATATATWTTNSTAFWKHAARCQQRQRRRKNPRRSFATRVPVK